MDENTIDRMDVLTLVVKKTRNKTRVEKYFNFLLDYCTTNDYLILSIFDNYVIFLKLNPLIAFAGLVLISTRLYLRHGTH